jgi:putative PIG3 family NAD(P)H quinone oxidoreductase
MKAIVIDTPGDEDVMHVGDAPEPDLVAGSIRIGVAAAGVNRADLLQRQGHYPPPPGGSPILGLECSGTVLEVAEDVTTWRPGDRVMALLPGGGYAEQVVVDAGSVLRVPEGLDLVEAAALPEVLLTVHSNVFELGGLRAGATLLVHGGGSGIGTAAIQLAKAAGADVFVTAGSDEKCERCRAMGADLAINYRKAAFADAVREATSGRGVDVVLDSIGGPYLADNMVSLAADGRLVVIGLMGGAKAEIPLGLLLAKRLSLIGSTLRGRTNEEKARLSQAFAARFFPDLESGAVRPVVDRVLPLDEAPTAHRVMKASEHFGKILLRLS